MSTPPGLARLEALFDEPRCAAAIAAAEERLGRGRRVRQCSVRTLLVGIAAALSMGRPAHLTAVLGALCGLTEPDQRRLGVVVDHRGCDHLLTYRQLEYTMGRVAAVLRVDEDAALLSGISDAVVEASIPDHYKDCSSALAVDWTDVESFAVPPRKGARGADPDATWGHRRGGGPGEKSELFFGYFCSLATMVPDDGQAAVPELVRQMTLSSCATDPVPVLTAALLRRYDEGVTPGDVLCDSGYSHRDPERFAIPLRARGATLVMDLQSHDRGPRGTFAGAILANGNCYCPQTPPSLFELSALPRRATLDEVKAHDLRCCELGRYKLVRLSGPDADGYERLTCPAVAGKLRCPLKVRSMAFDYTRPEVFDPPASPPKCCQQQSITVPPSVNAKTRQKHDYPSATWRRSYARRTAVERSNSRLKDPASIDIGRGWCRMMGHPALTLLLATAVACRNLALVDAFEAHQEDEARRLASGRPPKQRRRRRKSIGELATATAAN